MNPNPELSIVIPTIGRGKILERTLSALLMAVESFDVEIILVDDSKTGITVSPTYPIRIERSGGKGASYARNVGWRSAQADLLLFLDDDILIYAQHIRRTLELHKNHPNAAYNFFWEYPPELKEKLHASKFGRYMLKHKLYSNAHRLLDGHVLTGMTQELGLTSQYFSIAKKWMTEVGGYDPIPYAGAEDLLLFKKLSAVGLSVFLSRDNVVHQDESNKININSLVKRYRTGAHTRRVAVNMGHPEMGVHFSKIKKILAAADWLLEPLAQVINLIFPFGFLYEKAVNFRLFVGTYKGYYKDKLPSEFSE